MIQNVWWRLVLGGNEWRMMGTGFIEGLILDTYFHNLRAPQWLNRPCKLTQSSGYLQPRKCGSMTSNCSNCCPCLSSSSPKPQIQALLPRVNWNKTAENRLVLHSPKRATRYRRLSTSTVEPQVTSLPCQSHRQVPRTGSKRYVWAGQPNTTWLGLQWAIMVVTNQGELLDKEY